MPTIRTDCPECGPVDLTPSRVVLTHDLGQYIFQCPKCRSTVSKRADKTIVNMLVGAGVKTLSKPGPAATAELARIVQLAEQRDHPDGPQFTADDSLDFHASIDAELAALMDEGAP